MTDERPQSVFSQAYFDDHVVYARYADESPAELAHWYGALLRGIERISSGAIARRDELVLDAGCGFGPTSALFQARGTSVIGTDISIYALVRAAKIAPVPLVQSMVTALPLANASFDLVVAFELLEHVPNPFDALSELARVLKPGGRLLATTPNPFSSLLPGYDAWADDTHVSVLSPRRWRTAMRDCGFHDVSVRTLLNPPVVWRRFPDYVRSVRMPVIGPITVMMGVR